MNRHAVQTALGRVVRTPSTVTVAPITASSTKCLASRTFTSTRPSRSDEDPSDIVPKNDNTSGREKSAQAAAKLGQLVRTPSTFRIRKVSMDAAESPNAGGLGSEVSGEARALDARSLGARGTPAPGAKVINLRSLRERVAGGGAGRFGGAASGGAGGLGLGRIAGSRGGPSPGGRFGGARPGGPGGARGGRPGVGGRGGSRFGGAGRRGSSKFGDKKKKEDRLNDKPVDRPWSAAEQEILDRHDQGELTRYTPRAKLRDYLGYGPAVATDNTLGKMESALRTMRIMGGGRAFDNDPSSTVDSRTFAHRYLHDKETIFFNHLGEKRWLQKAMHKPIEGPSEVIKQAVVESVVAGKYPAPEFKDITDVKGLVANYQNREVSYRASHAQEFTDKLVSILPQPKAGKAAPARK